jgi:hypothetical protein
VEKRAEADERDLRELPALTVILQKNKQTTGYRRWALSCEAENCDLNDTDDRSLSTECTGTNRSARDFSGLKRVTLLMPGVLSYPDCGTFFSSVRPAQPNHELTELATGFSVRDYQDALLAGGGKDYGPAKTSANR